MSSVIFSKQNIHALIDHHIALLNRFDVSEQDEFSVIYFSYKGKSKEELTTIFQKILRKTDALFEQDDYILAMLPGTDWNGATELLSGIQEFLGQNPLDNIATYPEDGNNSKDILNKLYEIIKENCDVSVEELKS